MFDDHLGRGNKAFDVRRVWAPTSLSYKMSRLSLKSRSCCFENLQWIVKSVRCVYRVREFRSTRIFILAEVITPFKNVLPSTFVAGPLGIFTDSS
jgi:hypothetical protein